MGDSKKHGAAFRWALLLFLMIATFACTGCQVEYGGQILPSGFYQHDDVQYFPPGLEFQASREAAALQEARAQEAAEMR